MTGQRIGFATARDGVRIAYAISGRGPALVVPPHWFTHLELDVTSAVRRHWVSTLSAAHTLIRYDHRGSGLSDRGVRSQSLDLWLSDMTAVLDAVGVGPVTLLGVCQGGPVAMAYTAEHPDRVEALVLYGTYARCGPLGTRPAAEASLVGAVVRPHLDVTRGLREVLARLLLPDAGPEVAAAFVALQQASVAPEDADRISAAHAAIDVSGIAPDVRVPTLVLHLRDDLFVPFEQGRTVAALIPGGRLVPLDGRNHVLQPTDPAWDRLVTEVQHFVGAGPPDATHLPLTLREREILVLVAQGRGNDEIAHRLSLSVRTVERHLSNVYCKLGVNGRAARAAAAAHAARLAADEYVAAEPRYYAK
jgi:pimeloyl-ACP methyl ester carboxylesterase/DNA-binding CsgD family transcriptional regulator